MDDRCTRVWEGLVATPFGLYSTWEERLGALSGLSGLYFHVLQSLAEAPEGRLRLQDLAEAVRHSQSGTTRLVDRMEKEGWIVRHACAADRRVTWAMLSDRGRRAYDEALPHWNQFLLDHLQAGLTSTEADTLAALLAKLQATLAPEAARCPQKVSL